MKHTVFLKMLQTIKRIESVCLDFCLSLSLVKQYCTIATVVVVFDVIDIVFVVVVVVVDDDVIVIVFVDAVVAVVSHNIELFENKKKIHLPFTKIVTTNASFLKKDNQFKE
jgi:hypothetical protein